jgi:hypothetical protein
MNKVYNVLIGVLMLFGSMGTKAQQEMISSLSPKEIQRIETIFYLYENKNFESLNHDYSNNMETLNNDIALLEKHVALVKSDKNNAEKAIYAKVLPTIYKSAAIVSAGTFFLGGYCTASHISNIYHSKLIVYLDCGGYFYTAANIRYDLDRLPACIGATLLSALAAKMFWNASNKNKLFIEKLQKEYEQDMAIIVELKKIRYELTHS